MAVISKILKACVSKEVKILSVFASAEGLELSPKKLHVAKNQVFCFVFRFDACRMDMTCARNWAKDPRGQNCTGTCVQYQQVRCDLTHQTL